jgi:hypothetical protein
LHCAYAGIFKMTDYCEISGSPIKSESNEINSRVHKLINEILDERTKQILEAVCGLDMAVKLEILIKENAELKAKLERSEKVVMAARKAIADCNQELDDKFYKSFFEMEKEIQFLDETEGDK